MNMNLSCSRSKTRSCFAGHDQIDNPIWFLIFLAFGRVLCADSEMSAICVFKYKCVVLDLKWNSFTEASTKHWSLALWARNCSIDWPWRDEYISLEVQVGTCTCSLVWYLHVSMLPRVCAWPELFIVWCPVWKQHSPCGCVDLRGCAWGRCTTCSWSARCHSMQDMHDYKQCLTPSS